MSVFRAIAIKQIFSVFQITAMTVLSVIPVMKAELAVNCLKAECKRKKQKNLFFASFSLANLWKKRANGNIDFVNFTVYCADVVTFTIHATRACIPKIQVCFYFV
jgi:hypothetical protein